MTTTSELGRETPVEVCRSSETPEWKDFMKSGAFNTSFMTGDQFVKWVTDAEKRHESLMREAKFLASSK